MRYQRFLGVALVLMSVLIVLLAMHGTTPEESDITVVILLLPLGIYAIFTKQKITYDFNWETIGQNAVDETFHPAAEK